jgi:fumarate hydratase class II
MSKDFRTETDSMGQMKVPAAALWGAQTQRAVENFPISGLRFSAPFIRALGMEKLAAAQVNMELGLLDRGPGQAIESAAREVVDLKLNDQFVVDIFQTGSGTSTNMNANEVIANRANQILGSPLGSNKPVHPNDHVNMGQSSNDVIPTCIHVAAVMEIRERLLPALEELGSTLSKKAAEFDHIVKIGRTHMQDATPVRLGQEFRGWGSMVEHTGGRMEQALAALSELAIGGTAVGTGINTHPEFPARMVEKLSRMAGFEFREADNHFEAQGSRDAIVLTSGMLKTAAVSLMKIANDIRFLSCGPRCGISEIVLPEVQPGSSIMPGKVNPVIAEAVCQVAAQVIGNDGAVAVGGMLGHLELNVMMPVIAHNVLQSVHILAAASRNFSVRCIKGIEPDTERISGMIEQSLALCTALSPVIGYDKAAAVAKESHRTGRTVREVALDMGILPADELERVLEPYKMTERNPGR